MSALTVKKPAIKMPEGKIYTAPSWHYSHESIKVGGKAKLLWKFDCNPKESKYTLGGRADRNHIIGTPVFYDGYVYAGVGEDPEHGEGIGHYYCIDPTKRGDLSLELAVDKDGKEIPPRRLQCVDTKKGEKAIPNPKTGAVWHYDSVDRNKNGKIDRAKLLSDLLALRLLRGQHHVYGRVRDVVVDDRAERGVDGEADEFGRGGRGGRAGEEFTGREGESGSAGGGSAGTLGGGSENAVAVVDDVQVVGAHGKSIIRPLSAKFHKMESNAEDETDNRRNSAPFTGRCERNSDASPDRGGLGRQPRVREPAGEWEVRPAGEKDQ